MFIIKSWGPNLEPMVAVVAELWRFYVCLGGEGWGRGGDATCCKHTRSGKNAGLYQMGNLFSDW